MNLALVNGGLRRILAVDLQYCLIKHGAKGAVDLVFFGCQLNASKLLKLFGIFSQHKQSFESGRCPKQRQEPFTTNGSCSGPEVVGAILFLLPLRIKKLAAGSRDLHNSKAPRQPQPPWNPGGLALQFKHQTTLVGSSISVKNARYQSGRFVSNSNYYLLALCRRNALKTPTSFPTRP